MKTLIETLLERALAALPEDLVPAAARGVGIEVENTRDAQHGDFASNLAMRLGRATRQNPRKVAQALVAALPPNEAIDKVEIAGAGFINFFLKDDAYHREIGKVLQDGAAYGRSNLGAGRYVQVEFVSANPTGPLHVAHGRHAAFGASLSNLLEAAGYNVQREYYITMPAVKWIFWRSARGCAISSVAVKNSTFRPMPMSVNIWLRSESNCSPASARP